MAILNSVKKALRISHSLLDEELTANIGEARAEMIRSGVPFETAADDTNASVTAAIKAYCKMVNAPDRNSAEGYEKSWLYQLENLRKSSF